MIKIVTNRENTIACIKATRNSSKYKKTGIIIGKLCPKSAVKKFPTSGNQINPKRKLRKFPTAEPKEVVRLPIPTKTIPIRTHPEVIFPKSRNESEIVRAAYSSRSSRPKNKDTKISNIFAITVRNL